MRLWNDIKKLLALGCVYYTLVSVLLILIGFLSGSAEHTWNIPVNFWQIFPASLSFALAQNLLTSKRIARWKRYLSHYIICLLAVLFFFFLSSSATPQPVYTLLLLVFLTAIYWAIFGLVLLVRSRIRSLLQEDDDLHS